MASASSISIGTMVTKNDCLAHIPVSTVSNKISNLLCKANGASKELDLPEYPSYEKLRENLYTAMTAGGEYFGFA
jgi:hypothetical protein